MLGSSYTVHEVATGAATGQELSAEKAFLTGHKTLKGAFAVDAGSTQNLAQALGSTGLTIPNGGFDTTPTTLSNIEAGKTNFTIYQDPYMQGFLPTLYFYLYNISGGTVSPGRHRHGPDVHHQVQRQAVHREQPVPGLHQRAEVPAAPVWCDQQPDCHHQHLISGYPGYWQA